MEGSKSKRSTPAIFVSEASVMITNGVSKSGNVKTGACVKAVLSLLKAVVHLSVHVNEEYFDLSAVKGSANLEQCGMKRR